MEVLEVFDDDKVTYVHGKFSIVSLCYCQIA